MNKTLSNAKSIKNWPEADRPREKLLKKGAGARINENYGRKIFGFQMK